MFSEREEAREREAKSAGTCEGDSNLCERARGRLVPRLALPREGPRGGEFRVAHPPVSHSPKPDRGRTRPGTLNVPWLAAAPRPCT